MRSRAAESALGLGDDPVLVSSVPLRVGGRLAAGAHSRSRLARRTNADVHPRRPTTRSSRAS
eukprot:9483106-Pyramimonas_sp.AAC.1